MQIRVDPETFKPVPLYTQRELDKIRHTVLLLRVAGAHDPKVGAAVETIVRQMPVLGIEPVGSETEKSNF